LVELLVFLLIAVGFSFLCSLLEAAFLSTKESYILTLKEKGNKESILFEKLIQNKDNTISTILTINTFAHTLGAAGVGASAAKIFGESYMFLISFILTFIILIGSEIIPKTIGAMYWKQLFGFTAKTLTILNRFTKHSNKFLTLFTKIFKEPKDVISKEEVLINAKMSFNDGVLEENEIEVITNVLKLKQTLVKDVMTPRKMIFSLNENAIIQSIINDEQIVVHSRILLQKEDKDDIDSYVLKNDILTANGDTKLKDIEKNIITVSHLDNLSYILNKFLLTKEHIFLVLDEYHQVDGIITMEDLFETLIGKEITDETDVIEDLAKYAKEY